jgi:crossover junction endodeoxyribonuclease RuvC
MLILGLDPGLRRTGWGVIEADRGRLAFVAAGTIGPPTDADLADRLRVLHDGLAAMIAAQRPMAAAVEQTFVNRNPAATLKLGMARGVVLLAPALAGLPVAEYEPTVIKRAVVGTGRADKTQVQMMVRALLPASGSVGADAADALAVAITHAHMAETAGRIAAGSGRIG